ncbi:MAG: Nif3-like dinuclear metal center hexameric protein [Puniceicoccaceae bacterium]
MVTLDSVVKYANERLRIPQIVDFPGARNGLQVENNGAITKIGASVDAGLVPFSKAIAAGVDLLLVHHGLYWDPPEPLVGRHYQKIKLALEHNLAVYSAHLPLDLHPEIGNNALLARALGLTIEGRFLEYQGEAIGLLCTESPPRAELADGLHALYPHGHTLIAAGPSQPRRIGILTGSGTSALEHLAEKEVDTFITGELKQHAYNFAEENRLNLFLCGHYATETHGVNALMLELGTHFSLPTEFIPSDCPI